MNRIQVWGEALLFFAFVGWFRILGLKGASNFGGWFARTFGPLFPIHSQARKRLQRALPDLSKAEADRILFKMWDNLGRTMGELTHLDKFDPMNLDGRTEVVGGENVQAVVDAGKGGIFVSGHIGNWEVMPLVLKRHGAVGAEVYRAPNNPIVDRWLSKQRRTYIAPIQIPKGPQGAKDLVAAIKAKGIIAMLVDQKMNDGIEVPFFGMPAMTAGAAAQLHLRYGLPIVPATIERLPDQHFIIRVEEPISYEATGNRDADTKAIMTQINAFLEKQIRARPHEWLWLHKRWPKDPA